MVSRLYAQVGRVKSYLEQQDANLLPVSCTICVPRWDEDFWRATAYLIEYAIESLRAGVGVNVHLDYFTPTEGAEDYPSVIYTLNSNHADSNKWVGESSSFPNAYEIEDSISGIIEALKELVFAYSLDKYPGRLVFDFSKLRAEGVINQVGMMASGPESFKFIFVQLQNFLEDSSLPNLLRLISSFNQEIRRGGTFKNGAITTSLPWYHTEAYQYITMDKSDHPWLKKSVSVTADFLDLEEQVPYLIEEGINDGSLWIEKILTNSGSYVQTVQEAKLLLESERIRHNVCREILIKDRQTCTLGHVNAGQCFRPDMLEDAYVVSMSEILDTHRLNAPGMHPSGLYKDRLDDMQVGLGIIGLANMLGMHGIKYELFVAQLEAFLDYNHQVIQVLCEDTDQLMSDSSFMWSTDTISQQYVLHFVRGIIKAARMAKRAGMERAFCVAPTANSSFKHKDAKGNTTAPNICPPLGLQTERVSSTGSNEVVTYGNIEIAAEVGFPVYFRLVDNVQWLYNLTGLAHSISFDIWADVDEDWLNKWNHSHIRATYYRVRVDQSFLDKSDAFAGRLQCACSG